MDSFAAELHRITGYVTENKDKLDHTQETIDGLQAGLETAIQQGKTKPRNPRHFATIEGGRVYQALHIESKSVLDALCSV